MCLRSIPNFCSVDECQGLTPHNNLHTLRSDEPRGEGNMMSLPTNNNHPASPLTSTSPGFLATPQLSPLRAPPPPTSLGCFVNHLPSLASVMDLITSPEPAQLNEFARENRLVLKNWERWHNLYIRCLVILNLKRNRRQACTGVRANVNAGRTSCRWFMSGPTLAWYCSTVMEAHKRLPYLWDISSAKRMNQTHVAFGHTFYRDSLNFNICQR